MRLSIPILINCALVLVVYLADKYTPLKKLPYPVPPRMAGHMDKALSAETPAPHHAPWTEGPAIPGRQAVWTEQKCTQKLKSP